MGRATHCMGGIAPGWIAPSSGAITKLQLEICDARPAIVSEGEENISMDRIDHDKAEGENKELEERKKLFVKEKGKITTGIVARVCVILSTNYGIGDCGCIQYRYQLVIDDSLIK